MSDGLIIDYNLKRKTNHMESSQLLLEGAPYLNSLLSCIFSENFNPIVSIDQFV